MSKRQNAKCRRFRETFITWANIRDDRRHRGIIERKFKPMKEIWSFFKMNRKRKISHYTSLHKPKVKLNDSTAFWRTNISEMNKITINATRHLTTFPYAVVVDDKLSHFVFAIANIHVPFRAVYEAEEMTNLLLTLHTYCPPIEMTCRCEKLKLLFFYSNSVLLKDSLFPLLNKYF